MKAASEHYILTYVFLLQYVEGFYTRLKYIKKGRMSEEEAAIRIRAACITLRKDRILAEEVALESALQEIHAERECRCQAQQVTCLLLL